MINNEYIKTLDPALRLVSFTAYDRDASGKKRGTPPKNWREVQTVRAGDNAIALVLGEQRDGSFCYCLDFDADYKEAEAVHIEKFDRSGNCYYLEKTLHGGHIIIRTDGEVDLCGKQVIYKRDAEGRAICEQLGAGQCVYIYPSPEKARMCGDLNYIFPASAGRQFVKEVMERYDFDSDRLPAKPKGEKTPSSGRALVVTEAKRERGLDRFNRSADLVVAKLEEHGFKLMSEDETSYKFKRPGRPLDGDASVVLFKEPTKGENLRIKTFSHHMATYDETNSPSMFFQRENLESVDSLLRFTSRNDSRGPEVKSVAPKATRPKETKEASFDPTVPESLITFDKEREVFKVIATPADAIRYGIERADQKSVFQPAHLFPDSPIGRYFQQRNTVTLNPQGNGFVLAMFASIASMTSRLFRSQHYGTWYDKPAFLSMFLARTASGKDDVLKASRCLWGAFVDGFRAEWDGFPKPDRTVTRKQKDENGDDVEVDAVEDYPLIQFLTLDKICSYSGNVEASGPAMAKNVLLKGSHAVLVDEIQDQFVKKINGKYRVVDKASDLGKMLKETYTHDEGAYDASECKDDSNNVRPVNNPALTLFGTGTPNEIFVDYIDKESVEGGLRARLCVWKGWAYTDSRSFNPFDAIRKNRELKASSERMEADEAKRGAESYARQLGRLYALIMLKNSELCKDAEGRIRYDVTRNCPPIGIEWEDDAVDDYICYLAWIASEKDLSDDDVAILNRAQNKFSNLCLLYALSRLALSDDVIDAVKYRSGMGGAFASYFAGELIAESVKVNRDDVRRAFLFVVWDVVQMGVLRAQTFDARDEIKAKREGEVWERIFESSPYELDNGEKVITASWLAKRCEKGLLREAGLPLNGKKCVDALDDGTRPFLSRSDMKMKLEDASRPVYVYFLNREF